MDDSGKVIPTKLLAIKRWTCFIAAIWLQSINGTNFDFSVYSADLKKFMGINQIQLNSLAVASDLGKVMGWVSGVACAFLPTWSVLVIGMSLGMVGYGVQWLILSGIIQPLSYWQVYILCLLAGNSICWFNTVSFKAAIENFPIERGMASGLSTSYVGLSAVIYTCLSSILDPGNPSLYLLLNCTVPLVVGVISAVILHVSQLKMAAVEDDADKKYMTVCGLIALATAVYSIVFEFLPHGKRQIEGVYVAVMIILLMAPLYIPLKVSLKNIRGEIKVSAYISTPERQNPTVENSTNKVCCMVDLVQNEENKINIRSLDTETPLQTVHNFNHIKSKRFHFISVPPLGEEHGILQLLGSIDFWLYYFVYLCGGTVGIVYMNNLGQIVQSLGYSKTPILVSLVSSFGFFGRIASGLPDYIQECRMLRKYRPLQRTGWMGIWMVPLVPAFFMLRFMNPMTHSGVLYVSTAIVGTSAGAISAIAIPISSELFGLKSFGVNHNILVTNIAFGSLLFGEVAGFIYDDSSSSSVGMDKGPDCIGKQCYEKSFLIWGCVCLFGILLCVVLCRRTRELYESIRKKH
eukprot:PITA_35672